MCDWPKEADPLAKLAAHPHSPAPTRQRQFAHDSERCVAELFDTYGIVWEYEPVEFSLVYDEHGKVSSAFRPDFYLPEHGLFIELTTLRQELVTRKNRKVRQLRALYPELKIKMLYRADYLRLLEHRRLEDVKAAIAYTHPSPTLNTSQRSA